MVQELIFYTNPMSRGRIVRWMLEEVGAPYRTEILAYGPAMKAASYRRINPMGKVPAIIHGGTVVTECAAICAYLADAFPAAGLAPPPDERGAYYRWLFFAAGPAEAASFAQSIGWEATPEASGRVGFGSLALVTDTLEQAVQASPYIAGERFTAADVYVGMQLFWGMSFGQLEKRPAFEAYWAKVSDREALRRATALDDAAVAELAGS
jgi:glutathione S-transferase